MNREKIAIFVLGLNGSGKSTMRDQLNLLDNITVIDPDKIARDYKCTEIAAGKKAINLFNETIEKGNNFLLESTLTGNSTLQRIKIAKDNNYHVKAYFVGLENVNLHLMRVKNRVSKGGHNIPKETIMKRYQESYSNLQKLLPLVDYLTVIDNTHHYEIQAKMLNTKMEYKKDRKQWVDKFLTL